MRNEHMPKRAALMTLALESPETRQNTARTPGSNPTNACTCACPPTSSLSLSAHQAQPVHPQAAAF